MKTRLAPYRFSLLVVIILLAACGTRSPGQLANTPTSSVTDVNGTPLSGALTEVTQTMTAIPTSTVVPTDTLLPPTPTRTRLPFMALDGLRVVYTTSNGNLYVWDSGKQ